MSALVLICVYDAAPSDDAVKVLLKKKMTTTKKPIEAKNKNDAKYRKHLNKMNIKSYPNDICNSWKWCKKCVFFVCKRSINVWGKNFVFHYITYYTWWYRTNPAVFVSRLSTHSMIQTDFCRCFLFWFFHVRQETQTDSLSFSLTF